MGDVIILPSLNAQKMSEIDEYLNNKATQLEKLLSKNMNYSVSSDWTETDEQDLESIFKELRDRWRSLNTDKKSQSKVPERLAEIVRNASGFRRFKLPITRIANNLGFFVYEQNYLDGDGNNIDSFSGYVYIEKGKTPQKKVICVNKQHNRGHQDFTIAHELWHYFMDYYGDKKTYLTNEFTDKRDDSHAHLIEEKIADRFAACLMMPEEEFRDIYRFYTNLDYGNKQINTARWFGVSNTAVRKRCEDLGIKI